MSYLLDTDALSAWGEAIENSTAREQRGRRPPRPMVGRWLASATVERNKLS
jgi:hypothetical protein